VGKRIFYFTGGSGKGKVQKGGMSAIVILSLQEPLERREKKGKTGSKRGREGNGKKAVAKKKHEKAGEDLEENG